MTGTGKVAVITRTSGAIGSAASKKFADDGYSLVLNSRTRPEAAKARNSLLATLFLAFTTCITGQTLVVDGSFSLITS